ncbi:hypothetical protein BB561_001975 [Smittium simulii]|uniref:Band 7 domain-containing protein n=1 Tax=Smittium simulii TaxID=133385 RepID=A0A2T9YSB0_9FUNG|nr:hypothetical protein BB561_001975 [Smittium simulii]
MAHSDPLQKNSLDLLNKNLPGTSIHPDHISIKTQPNAPILTFNPPKFAVEHPVSSDSFYEAFMNSLGNVIGIFGQIPCCILCPNPFKTVGQGNIGLISRFGKYYKTTDPGLSYVNVITESIKTVDVKLRVSVIDHIPIVTKDNVNIVIDSVLYWHVLDPYLATYGVGNIDLALLERTQTILRSVLGRKTLQDLIENRETISEDIIQHIDAPSSDWGIKAESILIKDIKFSQELQVALSSAATQKRIGQSRVIAAQAEVDSAKLMREAADILNTPAAMQIRYLDTLNSMSKHSGTKVIFVPMSESGGVNANKADPSSSKSKDLLQIKNSNPSYELNSSIKDSVIFESLANTQ